MKKFLTILIVFNLFFSYADEVRITLLQHELIDNSNDKRYARYYCYDLEYILRADNLVINQEMPVFLPSQADQDYYDYNTDNNVWNFENNTQYIITSGDIFYKGTLEMKAVLSVPDYPTQYSEYMNTRTLDDHNDLTDLSQLDWQEITSNDLVGSTDIISNTTGEIRKFNGQDIIELEWEFLDYYGGVYPNLRWEDEFVGYLNGRIIKDESPPELSSFSYTLTTPDGSDNLPPDFEGKFYNTAADNNYWIKGTELEVACTPNDGDGAGLEMFRWLRGATQHYLYPQSSYNNTVTLGEGITYLQFYAKDRLNNSVTTEMYKVHLDGTAPSVPMPEFSEFQYIDEKKEQIYAKFVWDSSVDTLSDANSSSGMHSYETGGFSTNYDFNLSKIYCLVPVTLGENLTFQVKAVDRAGNESDPGSVSIYVPHALHINDVIPTSYVDDTGDTPVATYTNKITFNLDQIQLDDNDDNDDYRQEYVLHKTIGDETTEIVLTKDDLITDDENVFYYIDTISGAEYAHENIYYQIKTNIAQRYNSSFDIFNGETFKELANIPSHTEFSLKIGENDFDNSTWTNVFPEIVLSERYSAVGEDIEEDQVVYQLVYNLNQELFNENKVGLDPDSNQQLMYDVGVDAFTPNMSGVYPFYLQRTEAELNDGTIPVVPAGDPTDYYHLIKYDKDAPGIQSFDIYEVIEGGTDKSLSVSSPTNKYENTDEELNIYFSISLTGNEHSGFDFLKIYSGDVELETLYFKAPESEDEDITVYTDESLQNPASGVSIVEDAVTPDKYHLTISTIDLPHADDEDVTTTFRVELYDKAGNVSGDANSQKTVTVDLSEPTLTDANTNYISYDINNNGDYSDPGEDLFIEFTWTEQEVSTIEVSYTDLNGEPVSVTPDSPGEIILPVNGYNQAKEITLNAYDSAGNEATLDITGYSRAYIGNITSGSLENGVDITGETLVESNISRWVKFRYNDVIASSVYVQQLNDAGGTVGSPIYPDDDGYFTISGLGSRTIVNYKVMALNGAENLTSEIMTPITLDNVVPSFDDTETSFPEDNGYVTNGDSISWAYAIDTDLDALTYQLNIYDEAGVLLVDKSPVGTINTFYSIDSLGLENDVSYQWNVTVDDGVNDDEDDAVDVDDTLFDTSRSFKLDTTNPVVENVSIAGSTGFINSSELIFNVRDIENDERNNSGVQKVEIALNEDITEITTDHNFEAFNNINSSTVEIDLPEGEVLVDITVTDNVDIESSYPSFTVYVDRTLPQMSNFTITEVEDTGNFYTSDYLVPISFDIQDDFSGASHLLYAFTQTVDQVVNTDEWRRKDINSLIPQVGDSELYSVVKNITLQNEDFSNGNNKYLRLKIFDYAGNYIEYNSAKPILLDTTHPVISIPELDIWSNYGGNNYVSNTDLITGLDESANISDSESGIKISSKVIIEGTGTFESIEDITPAETLSDGTEYSILFYAENNASEEEIVNISSFIYDSSNPTDLIYNINEPEDRDYVKGETLTFDVSVNEPHTPIIYSEIIITDESGNNITGTFTGNIDATLQPNDSWSRTDLTDNNLQINSFSFTLPQDIDNGIYYVTITCKNAADLPITSSSYEFEVSNTIDVVTLAVSPYTKKLEKVYYDWNYIPSDESISNGVEVSSVNIQYKTEDDTDWTNCNNNGREITLPLGEEFIEGLRYSFRIEAELSNGTDIQGVSGSTLIDTIIPDISAEADMGLWPLYSESTKLYANWNIDDLGSGIGSVMFKVRKKVNGVFEKVHDEEWIEINGFNNIDSHIFSNLDITTGDSVIITRLISDRAGNIVSNTSPIILIDDTAPEIPVVINSTPFINPTYASEHLSQRPKVDWIQSVGDLETDVTYYWTFTQSKENIESDDVTWYETPEDKTVSITNEEIITFTDDLHQETWYFAIKAENSLGLASYGFCDGVTFDKTAPYISEVRVLEVVNVNSISEGEIVSKSYINNLENIHLYIQAFDNESGVNSYSGEYGIFDNSVFSTLSSSDDFTATAVDSIIRINNISGDLDAIIFKGITENGTGTPEIGYSSTVIIDTERPKVTELVGVNNSGEFSFSWNGVMGNSPITDYEYKIEKNDVEFQGWTKLESEIPLLYIDTRSDDSYVDGSYVLKVRAISESGLKSQELDEVGVSNTLVLDATVPVLDEPVTPLYASQTFSFTLSAADSGSGLSEYQYKIGTVTLPDLISGDWITIENSNGQVSVDIDFDDFPTTYDGIADGEEIVIRTMVKDNADNWSSESVSDVITIDKTPAIIDSINIPRYSRFTSRIENVSYNITDNESGVVTINYELVKIDGDIETSIFTATDNRAETENNINVTDETFSLSGDLLLNECDYKLKISAVNSTGDESSYVYSLDIVTIDTVKPVLTFNNYAAEEVVNASSEDNKYAISYTLSELCDVEFTLTKPDGTSVVTTGTNLNNTNTYGFHHWFDSESLAYGYYELVAIAHDRAGNDNSDIIMQEKPYEKRIRFNRPPKIEIYQTYVNPGRPITLSVDEQGTGTEEYYLASVVDLDGDYSAEDPFTYEWNFYNGNGPDNTDPIIITGKDGHLAFYHSSNSTRRTAYPFELKVTDNKGKSAVMSFAGISTNIPDSPEPLMFIVKNTWKGELFVDEYWTSDTDDYHKILGDIEVGFNNDGERLTLTVEEDTVVEVHSYTNDYNHGINVSGNIIAKDDSLFRAEDLTSSYWNGIVLADTGIGNFTGTTIQDAKRGITSINNATLSIDDCTFDDNIIGLHAYNNNPTIVNYSIFSNNRAYGIKEDGDSVPIVSDNTIFNNNTIDYYDSVNTVISGENN